MADSRRTDAISTGAIEMAPPEIARKELLDRLHAEFPQARDSLGGYVIEELWRGGCRLRQRYDPRSLRPGRTVSGATMMALGDFATYLAVLSAIGWVPLAVTTNLTINFLRKPAARDLLAEARLLKLGKRLAVGEVGIRAEGEDALAAHVTATYSIPTARR
jgi:uncharacterized protein (TIGR00369 family)